MWRMPLLVCGSLSRCVRPRAQPACSPLVSCGLCVRDQYDHHALLDRLYRRRFNLAGLRAVVCRSARRLLHPEVRRNRPARHGRPRGLRLQTRARAHDAAHRSLHCKNPAPPSTPNPSDIWSAQASAWSFDPVWPHLNGSVVHQTALRAVEHAQSPERGSAGTSASAQGPRTVRVAPPERTAVRRAQPGTALSSRSPSRCQCAARQMQRDMTYGD